MSRNLISKLTALLNEGGKKGEIETCEELIADDLNEYVKEKLLFELPTKEILKIVDKSDIEDIELIYSIISKMSECKKEESILLLNVIKASETTLEECIKILSKFDFSPICRRTSELFVEDEMLPERDGEHEISKLKKEIEELKKETKEKKTYFPPIKEKPPDFESNIHKASEEGKLTSVQYLVERCHADVETKNNYGYTPINKASQSGRLEVVKYLYEICHADVEPKDIVGRTSINNASRNGHLEVVKYLYETCHADVETKDNYYGRTLINGASYNGYLKVVKYLYETCHVNVETKDKGGNTPINNASQSGHLEIVKYLYETCHANVETKDYGECTPINNASLKGHLKVVKYLYETCHAKITDEVIESALTKEIKEYLLSRQLNW